MEPGYRRHAQVLRRVQVGDLPRIPQFALGLPSLPKAYRTVAHQTRWALDIKPGSSFQPYGLLCCIQEMDYLYVGH
jgi:hypothetical protein